MYDVHASVLYSIFCNNFTGDKENMISEENNALILTQRLLAEIKVAKKYYEEVKKQFEAKIIDEEEKKRALQNLLEKEYELQKFKGLTPKKGDWIVVRSKYGFKRVKVQEDDNCGW